MPCDPHCGEKALATFADLLMLGGAALLAMEAFARENDIDEVAQDLAALLNPLLAKLDFVIGGTPVSPGDKDLKEKLEKIIARQNRRRSLVPGILLTLAGFVLHIVSLWI